MNRRACFLGQAYYLRWREPPCDSPCPSLKGRFEVRVGARGLAAAALVRRRAQTRASGGSAARHFLLRVPPRVTTRVYQGWSGVDLRQKRGTRGGGRRPKKRIWRPSPAAPLAHNDVLVWWSQTTSCRERLMIIRSGQARSLQRSRYKGWQGVETPPAAADPSPLLAHPPSHTAEPPPPPAAAPPALAPTATCQRVTCCTTLRAVPGAENFGGDSSQEGSNAPQTTEAGSSTGGCHCEISEMQVATRCAVGGRATTGA